MNHLFRKYNTRFITIEKEFTVFEATGQEEELDNLAAELRSFGLIEFIKTARIAVANNSHAFDVY